MDQFKALLKCLKAELVKQEEFLVLLGQERAAIVKCKKEEIETANLKKAKLLSQAQKLEGKRRSIISTLPIETAQNEPIKLADIINCCDSSVIQTELKKTGEELKHLVTNVVDMNSANADLIKHSLGLVVSTLAIMRSAPGNDLPTYGKSGSIKKTEKPSSSRDKTLA